FITFYSHIFGMPLQSKHKMMNCTFTRFNHSIICNSVMDHIFTWFPIRLMMPTVHFHLLFSVDFFKLTIRLDINKMSSMFLRGMLTVLQEGTIHLGIYILIHITIQCYVDHLTSFTNTQDWFIHF